MPPDSFRVTQADTMDGAEVDLLVGLRAAQDSVGSVFRAMVDSVANPGRLHQLPVDGLSVAAAVLPVLVIADLRTSLAVVGPEPARVLLASALSRVTGAPIVDSVTDARIVLISECSFFSVDLIWELQAGTAHAPEVGATVIVRCERLVEESPGSVGACRTSGPGACEGRWFRADGIDGAVWRDLDRVNSGYPAGVDVYLVDDDGRLLALPRSNRLSPGQVA